MFKITRALHKTGDYQCTAYIDDEAVQFINEGIQYSYVMAETGLNIMPITEEDIKDVINCNEDNDKLRTLITTRGDKRGFIISLFTAIYYEVTEWMDQTETEEEVDWDSEYFAPSYEEEDQ